MIIHGGEDVEEAASDDGKSASTRVDTNTPCIQSNRNPKTFEDIKGED